MEINEEIILDNFIRLRFSDFYLQGSSKTLYKREKLFTNAKNFIQKVSSTYLAKIKKLLTNFASGVKIIAKIVDFLNFISKSDVNFTRVQDNRKNQ